MREILPVWTVTGEKDDMKGYAYCIPGLVASLIIGYALSLVVPPESLKRIAVRSGGEGKARSPEEGWVQQDDPYIEGLVRQLHPPVDE